MQEFITLQAEDHTLHRLMVVFQIKPLVSIREYFLNNDFLLPLTNGVYFLLTF